MLDQSNLVKNMAAAFGKLEPNLLENIRTSCKSQAEEEVNQSEDKKYEKINQKNYSKIVNDCAEFLDTETNKKNESFVKKSIQKYVKRSRSVPIKLKEERKKSMISCSLFNLNSSLEGTSLNNSNPLTQLQTKPNSKTSTKNTSLFGDINNRTSFMSADKVTMETILKNCDEMRKWSCEKVGQYLEEIILGQYKQIFLDNGINGHSLPFLKVETCIRRLQMKLSHAHTLIFSVHYHLGSYFFILEAHH